MILAFFARHETAVLGATIFTVMVVSYAVLWAVLAALRRQNRIDDLAAAHEAWETRHGTLLRRRDGAE